MGQPSEPVTEQVFTDPIVQLAALCPLCALAALSPAAALSAVSPVLRVYNPAINPVAALLSFALSNPHAAVSASIAGRITTRLTGLMTKIQQVRRR